MIDYLVPQFFLNFDAKSQAGIKNPSGGMRTKIRSVQKAMTGLQMYTHTRVDTLKSKFVLVEPLFFRENLPDQPKEGPLGSLEKLDDYHGVKILYCSEKELLRMKGEFREKLLEVFDVVTYNCEYQARLWEAIGIKDVKLLADPIDCELFRPLSKEFQVVSTGWISSDKNSEFIRDLYRALHETKLKTVYVGGNTLWGFNRKSNMRLEHDIRSLTDIFVENAPQDKLAKYVGEAAFFVGNTMHDTFSGCHAESVAAGCISVCGGHPLYSERFGFYVEPGVDATMEKLSKLTNGFADMPDKKLFESSRRWALNNVGFDAFNKQLAKILAGYVKVDHEFVKEGKVDGQQSGDGEGCNGSVGKGRERESDSVRKIGEERGTETTRVERAGEGSRVEGARVSRREKRGRSIRDSSSTGKRGAGRDAGGVQREENIESSGGGGSGNVKAVVLDDVDGKEGKLESLEDSGGK